MNRDIRGGMTTKKKAGRKPLPEEETKKSILSIAVSKSDKEWILAQAEAADTTLSSWCYARIMDGRPKRPRAAKKGS